MATAEVDGLPAVWAGRRRHWLLRLLANGLARALLAAAAVLALRAALAVPPSWPEPPLLVLLLAAAYAAGAWLLQRETVDAEALAQHYIAHVRLRLFDRLARLTPAQALQRSRGGVLMRFVGDVQSLRRWIGRGIAQAVVAGTTVALLWLVLLALAPGLALAAAAVLLAAGLVLRRLAPALYDATRQARRRQALVAAFMQDRIAGLSAWRSAGRAAAERARLDRLNGRLRRALQRRADAQGRHRAAVALAGGTLVLAAAVHAGLTGARTGLAGTLGTVLVVLLMLPAVRGLGQAVEAWVAARVARDRLAEFLDERPQAPRGAARIGERPALELEAPAWSGRVDGPAARVPWGRRIALCGPAGAGKSALLQLLAGLQPADAGAVRLDGVPLPAVAPGEWQRHVALLSAELPLLRGSVADNVAGARTSPDPRVLQQAVVLSGLAVLLPTLPEGMDTRVRDAGANLSHGQRCAVQLARCLAASPSILLIDDPAACLPGDTQHRLRELLAGFAGTVIYATQDDALAVLADEVWRFHAGRCEATWSTPRPALAV